MCFVPQFPGQTGEFVVHTVDWVRDSMVEVTTDGEKVYEQIDFLFMLHREPGTYRAVIFTPAAGQVHSDKNQKLSSASR